MEKKKMKVRHKQINKVGKIVVDTLLLALLWAVLALPASTFSLLHYDSNPKVLSVQDTRYYIEPLELAEDDDEDDEEKFQNFDVRY